MPISKDEVGLAFTDRLKTLQCPHCNALFTDFAVAWNEAWSEGRHDVLRELSREERDGPVKLKCEACGARSMTNAFLTPPKLIAET